MSFSRGSVGVGVWVCLLGLAACGARTGLPGEPPPPVDAFVADAPVDAGPLDAAARDAFSGCTSDSECDDGVECTLDRCVDGRCAPRTDDTRCAPSSICETGRCDRRMGCVFEPVRCADRTECTVDSCDPAMGCVSTPDDGLCPISHRCEVDRGCVAQAIIHDNRALFQVDLPSGVVRRIAGTMGIGFTDIALALDRNLYATDFFRIYLVDDLAGPVPILPTAPNSVGMEHGLDGRLYLAAPNQIVAIDLETGVQEPVASLPRGWVTSGDIATVEGRMLVTVTDEPFAETGFNQLAEVDLERGVSRILGPVGYPCVWGLAPFGPELYGFTCNGDLLRIDPFSGEAEFLRDLDLQVGGAAAR